MEELGRKLGCNCLSLGLVCPSRVHGLETGSPAAGTVENPQNL